MSIAAKILSVPVRIRRGLKEFRFYFIRIPGAWYIGDLRMATGLVREVSGDFIEMGAFMGNATRKLIPIASAHGKRVHVVDGFEGMGIPATEFDEREKGNLSIGGPETFHRAMIAAGFEKETYDAHVGWIPAILATIPDQKFSFAIVDLDNYTPTVDAIAWLWPKMSVGGIVAFDDFYPTHTSEASRAIKEFMARTVDFWISDYKNYQLYLVKK